MKRGAHSGAVANPAQLLESWGARVDPELLVLALTHRSFAYENGGLPHNERLEFLGDSVLSIIVTDWLFRRYPQKAESDLAKMRIAAVSQEPLAQTARELGLGEYVLLGVGENKTGGRDKDTILSDTLEALIGATYISCGLERTRDVLLAALQPILDHIEALALTTDWKTRLVEHAAGQGLGTVEYRGESSGPDHQRVFTAEAWVGDTVAGQAQGTSRKQAENRAARAAMLELLGPSADPTGQD